MLAKDSEQLWDSLSFSFTILYTLKSWFLKPSNEKKIGSKTRSLLLEKNKLCDFETNLVEKKK